MRRFPAVVAVVLILALAWAGWRAIDDEPPPNSPGDPSGSMLDVDAPDGPGAGLEGTGAAAGPIVEGAAVALPEPIDLDAVDRDLDVHGIVVGPDGPVAGAEIAAIHLPWRDVDLLSDGRYDEEVAGPSTRSARDGTFKLRLRRGDQVYLRVRAGGFAPFDLAHIGAGERVRIELARAVTLIVDFKTPGGAPAPDVSVTLFRGSHSADTTVRRSATSDERGRVVFDDLPPGGSVYLDVDVLREGWGNPGWNLIALPESGEKQMDFELPEGRTLTGRVTDAATGEPIPGARVGMNWVLKPEVRTDADGRYVLPGWSGKGTRDIACLAPGYGRDQATVGSESELDFALVPGLRVVGRVVGASGRPVPGAQVGAVASERVNQSQRTSFGTAFADALGRFEIDSLCRDMPHTIAVRAQGQGRTLFDLDASGADVLQVGDLALKTPHEVTGRVLDAAGEPVRRVRIVLAGANADRAARRASGIPAQDSYGNSDDRRTDDLGRFRFVDLAPGTYELTCRRTGAEVVSMTVQVDPPRTVHEVDLRLPGGRLLLIRLRDEAGAPVTGAHVSVQGRGNVGGQVDAHGEVSLVVAPDAKTVGVHVYERNDLITDPVSIPEGAETLDITLRAAAVTSGVIVQPDGTPIAGASVEARAPGSTERGTWAFADDAGSFTFALEPGAVIDVVFEGNVFRNGRSEQVAFRGRLEGVRAGSEGLRFVTTTIAGDRFLVVEALDPDGDPVEGVFVWLVPPLPGRGVVYTDATGSVRIEGLPATEVEVGVSGTVSVEQPWISPETTKVVPDGQTVTLRFERGVLLAGTVRKPDGSPQPAAIVSAMDTERGRPFGSFRTDPEGRFQLVVRPGASAIQITAAWGQGRELLFAQIEGVEADAGEIEIRLAARR